MGREWGGGVQKFVYPEGGTNPACTISTSSSPSGSNKGLAQK